jgi:hypothetical protein
MISNGLSKYIGSTKHPLDIRLRQHFYNYDNYKNNKYCYVSVFDLFEQNIDDVKIELLIEGEWDKKETRMLEGSFIKAYTDDGCVNKKNEGVTLDYAYYKASYKKHEDKRKESRKIRDAENRLKLNERQRIYRLKKKENNNLYTNNISDECEKSR